MTVGFFLTLAGTGVISCVYILNDYSLSRPVSGTFVSPTPKQQCFWVGTYCAGILFVIMLFSSIPAIQELPLGEPGVIMGYLGIWLSSWGHGWAYFELLKSTGAVATGILLALRAIGVFVLSHNLFCDFSDLQCFNHVKGVATFFVITGVIGYSLSKRREHPVADYIELKNNLQDLDRIYMKN
jgi:hypothetical protein